MLRVSHFRHDGEEGRRAGEGEDDGCYGRHGFCEVGSGYDFMVGDEDSGLGRGGWTVLYSYGDCEGQDCDLLVGSVLLIEYWRHWMGS